jgi:hypothetical protein
LEHLQWSATISTKLGSTDESSSTSSFFSIVSSFFFSSTGFSAFLNFPASVLAKF